MKNQDKLAANSYKFAEVSEAYDVLADSSRRAIFDQYGEELLKEGVTDQKGSRPPPPERRPEGRLRLPGQLL